MATSAIGTPARNATSMTATAAMVFEYSKVGVPITVLTLLVGWLLLVLLPA